MNKNVTTLVKGAIRSPESDVQQPASRRRSSSFASVVSDLEVGESASRTHRLNDTMTLGELRDDMRELKEMLRNNTAPAVSAARRNTGGTYTIEVGETIMPGGSIYLVVVVSRTA